MGGYPKAHTAILGFPIAPWTLFSFKRIVPFDPEDLGLHLVRNVDADGNPMDVIDNGTVMTYYAPIPFEDGAFVGPEALKHMKQICVFLNWHHFLRLNKHKAAGKTPDWDNMVKVAAAPRVTARGRSRSKGGRAGKARADTPASDLTASSSGGAAFQFPTPFSRGQRRQVQTIGAIVQEKIEEAAIKRAERREARKQEREKVKKASAMTMSQAEAAAAASQQTDWQSTQDADAPIVLAKATPSSPSPFNPLALMGSSPTQASTVDKAGHETAALPEDGDSDDDSDSDSNMGMPDLDFDPEEAWQELSEYAYSDYDEEDDRDDEMDVSEEKHVPKLPRDTEVDEGLWLDPLDRSAKDEYIIIEQVWREDFRKYIWNPTLRPALLEVGDETSSSPQSFFATSRVNMKDGQSWASRSYLFPDGFSLHLGDDRRT